MIQRYQSGHLHGQNDNQDSQESQYCNLIGQNVGKVKIVTLMVMVSMLILNPEVWNSYHDGQNGHQDI